ncbi:hypothetical protein ACFQGE_10230 [Halomicroarcula sp. GCM10025817]|uniref:hypothetical protein n=1 Tax=Haloarcula TaxID=2237 RepID=UPI0023E81512|nr:hypothetical protein [Halomicroarcula sp. SYNS111]
MVSEYVMGLHHNQSLDEMDSWDALAFGIGSIGFMIQLGIIGTISVLGFDLTASVFSDPFTVTIGFIMVEASALAIFLTNRFTASTFGQMSLLEQGSLLTALGTPILVAVSPAVMGFVQTNVWTMLIFGGVGVTGLFLSAVEPRTAK